MQQIDANDFLKDLVPNPELHAWIEQQPIANEPFPVCTGGEMQRMTVPPREDILGEAMLYPKGVFALVAPPGTGKTRFVIQAAAASLCGANIGPLSCPQRNLKWLILAGNENSVLRYRADIDALCRHYPPEFHALINNNIHFHIVNSFEDFMAPDSMKRIEATVAQVGADVVALDPLGDLIIGDANSDVDMRATLRSIGGAIWRASPNAAIWLIHHAREGRVNLAQAVGWDRGNYGKGSKALRAAVRSVMHLGNMDKDGSGNIVVTCGKCNDAQEFQGFGMTLTDGVYIHDPSFNLENWANDVEGKRSKGGCSIQDVVDFLAQNPKSGPKTIGLHFDIERGNMCRKLAPMLKDGYIRKTAAGLYSTTGKLAPRAPVDAGEEMP